MDSATSVTHNLPPQALTSHFGNLPELPRRGPPSYLFPGDPYNIRMGYSSVKKNLPFYNFDNPPIEPEVVGQALVDYLKSIGGVSLSAYQLGFEFQAMVIRDHDNKFMVCFNPTIVWSSPETAEAEEGSQSFPGVKVLIKRPFKIRVRYRDINGAVQTKALEGAPARFFQHEFDRVSGSVFWMAADKFHRSRAMKDWKQCERKLRTWTKNI